ncbi:MAG: hypothetical protein ACREA9_09515, partial [Pyrinomonadaceae bacterium]
MEKRDIKLVRLFLNQLNSDRAADYAITEQPDQTDRRNKAVEAIATDGSGNSIAIEHTLIQPFIGDKADAQPLLKVFAPLEADKAFVLPEHEIMVFVPVGGVQKGMKWDSLTAEIQVWFQNMKASLPEGTSKQAFS